VIRAHEALISLTLEGSCANHALILLLVQLAPMGVLSVHRRTIQTQSPDNVTYAMRTPIVLEELCFRCRGQVIGLIVLLYRNS
jgi:hypothetical protein